MSFSSSPIESPSSCFSSPNPSPTKTETDLPMDVDESFNSSMSLSDSPCLSPSHNARPSGSGIPALVYKRPDPVPIQRASSSKRTFGRELSLNTTRTGMMLPPAVPDKAKRAGIPMQWTQENGKLFQPMMRRDTEPISPTSMDIDSSDMGRSPLGSSPGLGAFFQDSPQGLAPGKRRSVVDDSPSISSGSPSAKRTSLRSMDKTVSSGAMLFESTGARSHTLAVRRGPQQLKRPLLAPVSTADSRTPSFASADAVLYAPKTSLGANLGTFPRGAPAPMRRAFSVCDQPGMPDMSEDESEYENSPSAMALHARKRSTLAPVDGSPYKAVRSSIAVPTMASPSKGKQPSMPGFGEDEMDGKVLPCHLVKEDGLVRITPDTLGDLIAGKYSHKLKRYHVIDCRFDYEFAGGHVDGAINVKTMDALDTLLLTEGRGLHAADETLPRPSRSGEQGDKVVLVFHCEFSAKRAPTFAKHLRRCDRTLNSHVYPKICYPEVYILEGGYSGFYQSQPNLCDPKGYVPMDDPRHLQSRNSDLHDFRKFSRTKSFTYGETQTLGAQPLAVRGAPACPPLAFAAGSIAQNRRHGSTIAEEAESPSGTSGGDSDASPCARVCSMSAAPIFGSAKTRTIGRMGGFARTASYAGAGSASRPPPRAPF